MSEIRISAMIPDGERYRLPASCRLTRSLLNWGHARHHFDRNPERWPTGWEVTAQPPSRPPIMANCAIAGSQYRAELKRRQRNDRAA